MASGSDNSKTLTTRIPSFNFGFKKGSLSSGVLVLVKGAVGAGVLQLAYVSKKSGVLVSCALVCVF